MSGMGATDFFGIFMAASTTSAGIVHAAPRPSVQGEAVNGHRPRIDPQVELILRRRFATLPEFGHTTRAVGAGGGGRWWICCF